MEIKASSKYNWETYKKFNNFHNFKRSVFQKVLNIIVLACTAILLVCDAVLLILGAFDAEMLGANMCIVYVALLYLLAYVILPRLNFKKSKILIDSENSFVFKEDSFEEQSENKQGKSQSEIKYSAIYKIYETGEFIYIYISHISAHIIEKSTIAESELNTLRGVLLNGVGTKKYIFKL